jgi:hypothetical protein
VSAKVKLLGAAIAMLLCCGCANRCDVAQSQCQYECKREYQVCELHGNDEWYCHNQIGACWANCDAARKSCHRWM